MDRASRVRRTIRGEATDRPPRGELQLGSTLAERIAGRGGRAGVLGAVDRLGFDFYGVLAAPETGQTRLPGPRARAALREEIRFFREASDLFLFVVVGGCFSDLAGVLGWESFLRLVHTEPRRLAAWSRRRALAWIGAAVEGVEAGAHGVVVADDLAHRTGTFARPETLRRHFFPILRDMVERLAPGAPVFLHSDGDLSAVLPDLVAMGFSGLHPLEPGAGMSPSRVGEATGWRVALAGGIDPAALATDDRETVRRAVRSALPPPGRGRYLAGTAWGFPDDTVEPGRLENLYRTIAAEAGAWFLSHDRHPSPEEGAPSAGKP